MGSIESHRHNSSIALEARVAAIAAEQHRSVTAAQLRGLGLTWTMIRRRVEKGYLHADHRGVFGVGCPPVTPLEKAHAAVLACGAGALLADASALALWDWADWPAKPHVAVPGDRRRPGIVVHRSKSLDRRDADRQRGIPVTSPARTLLDCARLLEARGKLTRTVNRALRSRFLTREALTGALVRHAGHAGARRLMPFVDLTGAPTRSQMEDDFVAFCAAHGLPSPVTNATVHGYEVDAWFPAERLIVEIDSWRFHGDREAFEIDRERDAHALEHGLATLRVTWERLHDRASREAERLHRILAARRPADDSRRRR